MKILFSLLGLSLALNAWQYKTHIDLTTELDTAYETKTMAEEAIKAHYEALNDSDINAEFDRLFQYNSSEACDRLLRENTCGWFYFNYPSEEGFVSRQESEEGM